MKIIMSKIRKIRKPVIREKVTMVDGVVSVTAQLGGRTFHGTAGSLHECHIMRDRKFGVKS